MNDSRTVVFLLEGNDVIHLSLVKPVQYPGDPPCLPHIRGYLCTGPYFHADIFSQGLRDTFKPTEVIPTHGYELLPGIGLEPEMEVEAR